MSRTHHHRSFARDFAPIFVGSYSGWAYCNWGAGFKEFMKRRTHKHARKFYKSEIRSALREADSLEVQFLTHRENVHAQPLHQTHEKYCVCEMCEREAHANYARYLEQQEMLEYNYRDSCGDPYCEYCKYCGYFCAHCGRQECEGNCMEWYSAEDAYYDKMYFDEQMYYRGE